MQSINVDSEIEKHRRTFCSLKPNPEEVQAMRIALKSVQDRFLSNEDVTLNIPDWLYLFLDDQMDYFERMIDLPRTQAGHQIFKREVKQFLEKFGDR